MMELSRGHAVGPRRPDLDKIELIAYEEAQKFLGSGKYFQICAETVRRRYEDILMEAKER